MSHRKLSIEEPHFKVWDDFLNPEEHRKIFEYIKEADLEFVHTDKKIKAFKVSDGNPLWGPPILSHFYEKNTLYPVYPVGDDRDILFREVIQMAEENPQIVGRRGKEWAYFFGRPYVYPINCGLGWHTDGKYGAPGAFVYYAHPEWQPSWGGELLLSSPDTKPHPGLGETFQSNWTNTHHNDLIMDYGIGHYVLPKPNRLVLMSGGFFHTIKKVDPAAGDNLRMTLQGFFQDPAKTLSR